jgi:hypothetical protein
MLNRKYDNFYRTVEEKAARFMGKVSEYAFDDFIAEVLADNSLNVPEVIYGRDGFACVQEIDKYLYQVVAFQINSFAPGVFADKIVKYVTPIMMTVKVHGEHPILISDIQDATLTVEEIYLGKGYCGSKGSLCDRTTFYPILKQLVAPTGKGSFRLNLCRRIMDANYLCHHIAETLAYAYGAFHVFWATKKKMAFLTAGSHYEESSDKLRVTIIDDFSGEKMKSSFQISPYGKLTGKVADFRENQGLILLEIEYKNDLEGFYLPSGYQKVSRKLFHDKARVITTQHIIEHLLADYYKRNNAFVVANTFQILEHLSRGMLAKIAGNKDEAAKFIREASVCKGQRPEINLEEIFKKEDDKFPVFASEFAYGMFFRPPVVR